MRKHYPHDFSDNCHGLLLVHFFFRCFRFLKYFCKVLLFQLLMFVDLLK